MDYTLILKILGIIGSLIASIKAVGIIITIIKCEQFQKQIIPKYLGMMKYAKENKLKIAKMVQFEGNNIIKPYRPHPKTKDFLDMVMDLFNDMDSFASYFVNSKIMNNYIAYKSQGKAFCDIIDSLYNIFKLFIFIRKEDYNNLIELYNIWKSKI